MSDSRSGLPGAATFTCSIPDMECADCATRVERAIRPLSGVLDLTTSVVGQRVTVRFDSTRLDADRIREAVREAGYTAGEPREVDEESVSVWRDPTKIRTILSALLFFSGLVCRLLLPDPSHAPRWVGHAGLGDGLLIGAALVGGFNFFPQGLRALRHLTLDMSFLMTAAIFGAIAIGEYAEAGAIAFLFSTAELLEDYAIERARGSLKALMELAPDTAVVRRDGLELTVVAGEVIRDEVVIVRPGDKVPVDGVVVVGASSVDQASITGESMPVYKEPGSTVFAGTLNHEGYLEARATRVAGDTTLGRIISMVEDAEEHRAPSEDFVRRFARLYTPIITVAAVALMTLPPLALDADFATWFVRGLTLLVIACPCALVISTPVAVVSGITSAARNGVLIKGGNYLEQLATIRVVTFDKTGTLTQGRPHVTRVTAHGNHDETDVLRIAAALEERSQHPLARAITARARGLNVPEASDFESITGLGVRGHVLGRTYTVGRPELFATIEPRPDTGDEEATRVLVGDEQEIIGSITLADAVRDEARDAVAALRRLGMSRLVMLTGDNEETARAVAEAVGVDEWRAGLLPQEKVSAVQELTGQYGHVAMVGDGVNDAPALVAATVGIAMGAAGSDTALETADVALMGDDLSRLPYLFTLSRRSRAVIRQNVWSSILIKFSLAAGVFPGVVSLAAAVLVGDLGTSLAVTANALRLARTHS